MTNFTETEVLDILQKAPSAKPWKTALTIAKALQDDSKADQVTDLLVQIWRKDNPQARPSYYPSKKSLQILWAHTSKVGNERGPTNIFRESAGDGEETKYEDVKIPEGSIPLFLSHSHADEKMAIEIYVKLAEQNFHLWLAEVEIPEGDLITPRIQTAMAASKAVLVLLTPHSIGSLWVFKELGEAYRSRKEKDEAIISVVDTSNKAFVEALVGSFAEPDKICPKMPADTDNPKIWKNTALELVGALNEEFSRNTMCGYPHSHVELDRGNAVRFQPLRDRLKKL